MSDDVAVTAPPPSSAPTGETKEQRVWYFYDWANSAYVTTTATVLLSPYLATVATDAACPGLSEGQKCLQTLNVVGIPVDPGSLFAYTATVSTIISALVLIVVGGIADRSRRPTTLFAGFAWVGAATACLMFFVSGTSWQLAVVLFLIANLCLGASLVIYDSLLCRIAAPDDRDKVSSKGWGFGYLGGGILLALNFGLDMFHARLGLDRAMSTRLSLLSAGLWWAGGGGVLQPLPSHGARHELVRHADLRARPPVHQLLPVGDRRPRRLLRSRRSPALPGADAGGHHRGRQRRPPGRLTGDLTAGGGHPAYSGFAPSLVR